MLYKLRHKAHKLFDRLYSNPNERLQAYQWLAFHFSDSQGMRDGRSGRTHIRYMNEYGCQQVINLLDTLFHNAEMTANLSQTVPVCVVKTIINQWNETTRPQLLKNPTLLDCLAILHDNCFIESPVLETQSAIDTTPTPGIENDSQVLAMSNEDKKNFLVYRLDEITEKIKANASLKAHEIYLLQLIEEMCFANAIESTDILYKIAIVCQHYLANLQQAYADVLPEIQQALTESQTMLSNQTAANNELLPVADDKTNEIKFSRKNQPDDYAKNLKIIQRSVQQFNKEIQAKTEKVVAEQTPTRLATNSNFFQPLKPTFNRNDYFTKISRLSSVELTEKLTSLAAKQPLEDPSAEKIRIIKKLLELREKKQNNLTEKSKIQKKSIEKLEIEQEIAQISLRIKTLFIKQYAENEIPNITCKRSSNDKKLSSNEILICLTEQSTLPLIELIGLFDFRKTSNPIVAFLWALGQNKQTEIYLRPHKTEFACEITYILNILDRLENEFAHYENNSKEVICIQYPARTFPCDDNKEQNGKAEDHLIFLRRTSTTSIFHFLNRINFFNLKRTVFDKVVMLIYDHNRNKSYYYGGNNEHYRTVTSDLLKQGLQPDGSFKLNNFVSNEGLFLLIFNAQYLDKKNGNIRHQTKNDRHLKRWLNNVTEKESYQLHYLDDDNHSPSFPRPS